MRGDAGTRWGFGGGGDEEVVGMGCGGGGLNGEESSISS
jgi:hypothetical protein